MLNANKTQSDPAQKSAAVSARHYLFCQVSREGAELHQTERGAVPSFVLGATKRSAYTQEAVG